MKMICSCKPEHDQYLHYFAYTPVHLIIVKFFAKLWDTVDLHVSEIN